MKKGELKLLVVLLLLFSSVGVLSAFGYPISADEGISIWKIYPSTFIILVLVVVRQKSFLKYLRNDKDYWKILFCGLLVFLVSNLTRISKGNLFLLDTIIAPMLLWPLLSQTNIKYKIPVRKVLFGCYLLNIFLSLVEKIRSVGVFDYFEINIYSISDGATNDFRSTSFMGHPLNNALITSFLTAFFLHTSISKFHRYFILLVGFVGLQCFGGRMSIIGLIVFCLMEFSFMQGQKGGVLKFIKASIVMALLAVFLLYVDNYLSIGLMGRFSDYGFDFSDDSAIARLDLLSLVQMVDFKAIIFQGFLEQQYESMFALWDRDIIENFWIAWLIKYGILQFVILSFSFFYLLRRYHKSVTDRRGAFGLIFLFLLVSSANNSLAASTSALSIFSLCFWLLDRENTQHQLITRSN